MSITGQHVFLFKMRRLFTWGYLVRVGLTATLLLAVVQLVSVLNNSRKAPVSRKFESAEAIQERLKNGQPMAKTPTNVLEQTIPLAKMGPPSFCPTKEIMGSSRVTRLGRYPTAKRFLSIGIASIARPSNKNYLLNTTQSLMDNLSEMDKEDTYIVIFLADFHEPTKSARAAELSRTFGKYIDQGLLTVIVAYPEYYPPLYNIKERFGDSRERRFWRAKQNVDTAFVMCYCKDASQYYIHLEDDVISSPSFFPKLKAFLTKSETFLILDVSRKGNVAKLHHSEDLSNSASFFYLMYDEMPVDWLMARLRGIKESSKMRRLPLVASLFQHTGILSSLAEKGPKGPKHEEQFFDLYDQKYTGLNPPASVTSSLSSHEIERKGSPQHAYEKGSGYFWGKAPSKDDYVIIKFNVSTAVQKVFVDTGSLLGPQHVLKSGILQASFELTNQERSLLKGGDGCGNFETCGSFSKGKVTITFNNSKKLTCLRILATANQDEPLFLREIDVWP